MTGPTASPSPLHGCPELALYQAAHEDWVSGHAIHKDALRLAGGALCIVAHAQGIPPEQLLIATRDGRHEPFLFEGETNPVALRLHARELRRQTAVSMLLECYFA